MKFVVWRESDSTGGPPTLFKPLSSRHVSTAYCNYTEWTIELNDLAELKAFQEFERDNYAPLWKGGMNAGNRGVRLEIKFFRLHEADGLITILDKRAADYGGIQ